MIAITRSERGKAYSSRSTVYGGLHAGLRPLWLSKTETKRTVNGKPKRDGVSNPNNNRTTAFGSPVEFLVNNGLLK